jgi:hypothetical protein
MPGILKHGRQRIETVRWRFGDWHRAGARRLAGLRQVRPSDATRGRCRLLMDCPGSASYCWPPDLRHWSANSSTLWVGIVPGCPLSGPGETVASMPATGSATLERGGRFQLISVFGCPGSVSSRRLRNNNPPRLRSIKVRLRSG